MIQSAWLATALSTAIACIMLGNLTHFTWWGILQFYVLCLMNAAGVGERFVLAYVFQAVLIIIGVATMSMTGCALLEDAADEWDLLYVPLNFAIHYAPSLIAIAWAPKVPVTKPGSQIALGGLTFVVYAHTTNSPSTYGCHVPLGVAPLVVIIATIAMLSPIGIRFMTKSLIRA